MRANLTLYIISISGSYDSAERKSSELIDNSDLESSSKENPLSDSKNHSCDIQLPPPPASQLFQGTLLMLNISSVTRLMIGVMNNNLYSHCSPCAGISG